jgi:4a-hydroxytetrahydrobiopterin dehydratase
VPVTEGWQEVDGALEREFRFADFAEALAFVNRVGGAAEAANHHPDIEIHWNRVKLRWWTHVANAITERDHEMARRSDELAQRRSRNDLPHDRSEQTEHGQSPRS